MYRDGIWMTDGALDHFVLEDVFLDGREHGKADAICGYVVIIGSMTEPSRPPCHACARTLDAEPPSRAWTPEPRRRSHRHRAPTRNLLDRVLRHHV